MATPFFVPFLSGALIKRQEISDEYDNTAGEIIDAASANYKSKLKKNELGIKLQDSNFAAVETAFGTTVAEAAAKYGLLEGVETAKIVNYVNQSMPKGLVTKLQKLNFKPDGKTLQGSDKVLFDSIYLDSII